MDPATEARETADRLAALAVGLRRLDDSSFAELAVVLREAFEVGCYYLYRAASAWDAGAVDEARLAVAALAGCDLLVRRQVHRLGQTLGSTLMPDYLDE